MLPSTKVPSKNENYSYTPNEDLIQKFKVAVLPTGHVGTLNHKGMQMATPSPLVDHWIRAYDGQLPLVDIGSAYGINTFKAAIAGANVVAIDMSEEQLQYIKEQWESIPDNASAGTITTMYGQFPELDLVDKNLKASAVLCAEVIHFLRGAELKQTFKRMHDILKPGGLLALTACGLGLYDMAESLDIKAYHSRKARNDPWPGEEVLSETSDLNESLKLPKVSFPKFMHAFTLEQIRELAEESGFAVESCQHALHPGLPNVVLMKEIKNANIQILAIRKD
eukprot:CFRG6059T1